METLLDLIRTTKKEVSAAPWRVLRDSLFASFAAFALALSFTPDPNFSMDYPWPLVALTLGGARVLLRLWTNSAEDWEFYCRPVERELREAAKERAERVARWKREREEAKKEAARLERLWLLTRTDLTPSSKDEEANK